MPFLRRALFWLVGIIGVIAVLLVIVYVEEDFRGARAWAQCQRDLAAKGEILDLRALVSPAKPEDDLSKAAIFAPLYDDASSAKAPIKQVNIYLSYVDFTNYPKYPDYLKGQLIDLAAWQKYYRTNPSAHLTDQGRTPAQDILQVLSRFDPQMNEIDTVYRNPDAAYWTMNYEKPFDIRLTGITELIPLAKLLQLRAVAHLQNGESELAEKDYLLSLRLNRPFVNQCNLVCLLLAAGVRAIDDSILFEGFERHAWNDVQLREMETALASTDSLALATTCFRQERACALQTTAYIEGSHVALPNTGQLAVDPIPLNFLLHLRPKGWWDLDQRAYSLEIQDLIESIDLSRGTLHPPAVAIAPAKNSGLKIFQTITTPLTTITLPAIVSVVAKQVRVETYRRLARLACRLEEYRLTHGQYPDALTDLPDLPAHLNQEVLSEAPLHYQRKGEGYLLYSIGWNQKDDGGVLANDSKDGDWPWPSPDATPAPAQK